jgi:hypothetical protein
MLEFTHNELYQLGQVAAIGNIGLRALVAKTISGSFHEDVLYSQVLSK